jgi:hypothetical protein
VRIKRVEIRGCRFGQNEAAMLLLGMFLGAKEVRAPVVRDDFAVVQINVRGKYLAGSGWRKFTSNKRGKEEIHRKNSTAEQFGVLYEFADRPGRADQLHLGANRQSVALSVEHLDVLQAFLTQRFGPYRGAPLKNKGWLALQFLHLFPPVYPRDEAFRKHLKLVSVNLGVF